MTTEFKKGLLRFYRRCAISGYHHLECEGAHIIPRGICRDLGRKDLIRNWSNGILLGSHFHKNYDRYRWSLDIFNTRSVNSMTCEVMLVVSPSYQEKAFSFNPYHSRWVHVPIHSLPFLWVNYQVFLDINFRLPSQQKGKLLDCYRKWIHSETFQRLSSAENSLALLSANSDTSAQEKGILTVIQSNLNRDRYLVLEEGQPWTSQRWVMEEDLCPLAVREYWNLRESDSDGDYKERGGQKRKRASEEVVDHNLRKKTRISYIDLAGLDSASSSKEDS